LDGFPNELRSVAGALEVLAEHAHFGSFQTIDFRAKMLSSLLRSCADRCEDVILSFRSWMKRNPRYFDQQSIFKTKLLRYIKSATGRWHYQLTADFINGALVLAASDGEEYEPDVTPAALRQLVTRDISKEERRKRYRRMARAMSI